MAQETTKIKLSRKQQLALSILDDPQIVDMLFGGGAGGAKSITICIWILLQCRNFPGIRIGLGRKELTRLKQTTVVTLLREVHRMFEVSSAEFNYSEQKGLITYVNGSSIQLVELAYLPSDPDYDRFGSLNLTHTVIEEAGEVPKKSKEVFTSRKNRFLNGEYGIVGKSLYTCNPSQNFLKPDYYKPYERAGAGDYQKWEFGNVIVDGKRLTAYRAFIQSLAKDNPFLPPNYIEVLNMLPPAERKRLRDGNWNYGDTDLMLFPSRILDRIARDLILHDPETPPHRFIGVDIADSGDDDTILTLVENDTAVDQQKIVVDKDKAIGEQIALAIIKYAQQHGMDNTNARDIGIDGVGVGASTRDFMRSKGWNIRVFIAGAAPTASIKVGDKDVITFKNLRGQTVYNMSQDMDKGEFSVFKDIPFRDEIREQLMAHEYETQERMILVTQKEVIKKNIGRSPDNAESLYIAYWVAKGDNDPRRNSSRIVV